MADIVSFRGQRVRFSNQRVSLEYVVVRKRIDVFFVTKASHIKEKPIPTLEPVLLVRLDKLIERGGLEGPRREVKRMGMLAPLSREARRKEVFPVPLVRRIVMVALVVWVEL